MQYPTSKITMFAQVERIKFLKRFISFFSHATNLTIRYDDQLKIAPDL